jgi:hypothetical protein
MAGMCSPWNATARGFWLFVGWAAHLKYDIGPGAVSTLGVVGQIMVNSKRNATRESAQRCVKVRNAR